MIYNKNITVRLLLNNGESLTFDRTKITDLSLTNELTSDYDTISYGCCPCSGNLQILDYDNSIQTYINNGLINENSLYIEIYINNVMLSKNISTSNSYNSETKILKLELSDEIYNWDSISFPFRQLTDECSAYDLLVEIFNFIGKTEEEVETMCSSQALLQDNETIGTVKDLLNNIKIKFPYLEKSSFREVVDKICLLGQLQCFLDRNGNIKFVSARPILLNNNEDDIILIPSSSQYNALSFELIKNNKFETIGYTNLEYQHKYNFILSGNATYYQQSSSSMITYNGENYMSYSGVLSDYKEDISVSDIEILGTIDTTDDFNNYMKLVKVKFSGNLENTITKGKSILIVPSNRNYNLHIEAIFGTVQPSEKTKYHLLNTNVNSDLSAISEDFETNNVIYVNSENEVLYEYGKVYVLKDNNNYTIYGTVQIVSTSTYNQNNYEGNLALIAINDALSLSIHSLTVKNNNTVNDDADFSIASNELMALSTYSIYDNNNILNVLVNNIKLDYSNGFANGDINVAVMDYSSISGNKKIEINNGEILLLNNTVKVEGDDRYWKIVGKTINKYPKLELNIIELKERIAIFEPIAIDNYNNTSFDFLTLNDGNYVISSWNTVLESSNLIEWNNITPTAIGTGEITGIKYINNKLFILRNNGSPLYSENNGNNWNNNGTIQDNFRAKDIAFGNDVYVIVGAMNSSNHNLAYSNDGISWNTVTTSSEYDPYINLEMVTFGNGIFLAISTSSSTPVIFYSYDGINWGSTNINNGEYQFISGIAYGNNCFVIVAETGIFYSNDGINWSKIKSLNGSPRGLNFINNRFIFYYDNYIYESSDGKSWNKIKVDSEFKYPAFDSFIYHNGNGYIYPLGVGSNNRGLIGKFSISIK